LSKFADAVENDEHSVSTWCIGSWWRQQLSLNVSAVGRRPGNSVDPWLQAMAEILLDAVNEERRYQGRQPLTNEELQVLIPFDSRC
jgi:hypothetical protein